MIRLHAVVEGQTEETFVNRILAPEFEAQGVSIDALQITTGRRGLYVYRGGIQSYNQLKNDLFLWMRQDQNPGAWFTTMVDFYALPKDFPGYRDCIARRDALEQVECLEEDLQADVSQPRFIPYLQLHEFEALLFSDIAKFEGVFPSEPEAIQKL